MHEHDGVIPIHLNQACFENLKRFTPCILTNTSMDLSKGRNLKCGQSMKYKGVHFRFIYHWGKLQIIETSNLKAMLKYFTPSPAS